MTTTTAAHFLPIVDIRKQFAGLSKDDDDERIEAAKNLNLLIRKTSQDREQTVKYCLTRLIKGLTSSNDSSRKGFSLALSELLYSLLDETSRSPISTDLHFRSILQLMIENTEPIGSLSKQEERGFYFGRLFCLRALIDSGVPLGRNTDISKWQSVLTQLILLAQKKPWLRETCFLVIRDCVRGIGRTEKDLIKVTCEELEKSRMIKTSDGVGIWIAMLQSHKSTLDSLNIQFQNRSSPLDKSYLQNLSKILKESEGRDEENNQRLMQKGSWNARLSWVWDDIFQFYAQGGASEESHASFEEFWQAVVNDGLFSNSASEERKFWGFLVFNKALAVFGDNETLASLFSPNFMKCFINQLGTPERYLHKAAQKSLRTIKLKAEECPGAVSTLLRCLLTGNGSPNFETIAKAKVIEPLFTCADKRGLLEIVQLFKTLLMHPDAEDAKAVGRSRQWAADQLLSMVRSNKIELHKSWVSEIINFLAEYGYFNIESPDISGDLSISPATQATLRTRLSSCLSELLQRSEFRDTVWSAKAILLIQKRREEGNNEFAIPIDETIDNQASRVTKIVSKLDKKSPTSGSRQCAFELMYSLLLLQLFNGEPDAMDMLEDLHIVYEKIGKESKKGGRKDQHKHKRHKHKHDHDEAEEEGGLEILIELLLGFLAKPSVLAKKMSQTVFKSFVDFLSPLALEILLRPLGVSENQDGQKELFDIEDEDEDMGDASLSDEDDQGSELDSDVDITELDAQGEDEGSEDDSNSDDSEEDGDDDSDDGDDDEEDGPLDEETKRLHAALAEALGTSADPNRNPDSDSDEPMDDDQMLLVDEQLSKIFKQRKAPNKRQQKASAKESVVNFKNRILELLEIYVKGEAKNDEKIAVILPCLETIRRTTNQAVKGHAQNVLKALTQSNKKKGNAKEKDEDHTEAEIRFSDPDAAFEILEQIHKESALRSQSREHTNSCSQCSLYISKLLINTDRSWIQRITQLYFSETMVSWMTDSKCGSHQTLFTDFVTWAGTMRNSLTAPTTEKLELNWKGGKVEKKRKRK
ncbi:hypothetical protein ABW19_dt0209445 [Dactylella cylindrospora]|nr:hypothetical protein ABW19_dt0209445 [Dactylella cylindrospora]